MNLASEIAALERLALPELRLRYTELFSEATRVSQRAWLIKRMAWRLQALAEGDLSERARQRARELAQDADLRLGPPRPSQRASAAAADPASGHETDLPGSLRPADARLPLPGAILTRQYKGQRLEVTVLERGFAYQGRVYRSLSAVAKTITGSHCSGFLFFRTAMGPMGPVGPKEDKP